MTATIHVENLVAIAFRSVFLYNPQGNIQQPYIRGYISLFSLDANPLASVFFLNDVLFRQAFQVGIGQTGKRGEDKPVADTLQVSLVELCRHQLIQVFEFQMAAFTLRQFRVQFIVGITS